MYSLKLILAVAFLALVNVFNSGEAREIITSPIILLSPYQYQDFEIPLYRPRRSPQNKFGLSAENNNGVNSLRADLSGTLMKSDRSQLDGNAYYQRNFGAAPKYQTGAGLDFKHDSGVFTSAQYDQMPGLKHFGAKAGYNFVDNDRTKIGVGASYDRSFTPFGPTRPNYGVFGGVSYRF